MIGREVDRFLLAKNVSHCFDFGVGEVSAKQEWVDGCFAELHERVIFVLIFSCFDAFNTLSRSCNGSVYMAIVDFSLVRVQGTVLYSTRLCRQMLQDLSFLSAQDKRRKHRLSSGDSLIG